MERNIPHVLDVFTCSPRARRRVHDVSKISTTTTKDLDKNPGSDSAVSVGSSEASDDETISRYFDYLNDDEDVSRKQNKKKKKSGKEKEGGGKEKGGGGGGGSNNNRNYKDQGVRREGGGGGGGNKKEEEHQSRKGEYEKDFRHIERHLSMKKTIRKKMMRDLQQAFVEDPGEFQQDPKSMTTEKKTNIDIRNLTFSKSRLSKSEHNFLDMLKDEEKENEKKNRFNKNNKHRGSRDNLKDDDSGNGSPSREPASPAKEGEKETKKEEKKIGFWRKLTGKGKSKR